MAKKRRELTPSQNQALERLKAVWEVKRVELNLSQEALGLACGWNGQSAVSQYLGGFVPLNVEAVLRLAKALKIHPAEIMPEVSEILPSMRREGVVRERRGDYEPGGGDGGNGKGAGDAGGLTPEAVEFAAAWQSLPADQRAALKLATEALAGEAQKRRRPRKPAA